MRCCGWRGLPGGLGWGDERASGGGSPAALINLILMVNRSGSQIREDFLRFFEGKVSQATGQGHRRVHSSSLVPMNDPGAVVKRTAELVRDAAERQFLARNGRQTILEQMHLAVTMKEVAGLYERAFETFAARQQQPAPLDVRALAAQTPAGAAASGGEAPMCGFPVAIQARIRMLENLAWGESLLRQKQWTSALGMIGQECLKNPSSLQPWRTLARNLLPGFATARLAQMTKG